MLRFTILGLLSVMLVLVNVQSQRSDFERFPDSIPLRKETVNKGGDGGSGSAQLQQGDASDANVSGGNGGDGGNVRQTSLSRPGPNGVADRPRSGINVGGQGGSGSVQAQQGIASEAFVDGGRGGRGGDVQSSASVARFESGSLRGSEFAQGSRRVDGFEVDPSFERAHARFAAGGVGIRQRQSGGFIDLDGPIVGSAIPTVHRGAALPDVESFHSFGAVPVSQRFRVGVDDRSQFRQRISSRRTNSARQGINLGGKGGDGSVQLQQGSGSSADVSGGNGGNGGDVFAK